MRQWITTLAVAAMVGGGTLVLAGCAADGGKGGHEVSAQHGDHPMSCKLCYDEVKTIRTGSVRGSQWQQNQVVKRHKCKDCHDEMTIYTQDGTLMVKCAKCAPKGLPCDRCLPPQS
jgi:hypothetical protein